MKENNIESFLNHIEEYVTASIRREVSVSIWSQNRRWCQSYTLRRVESRVIWSIDRNTVLSKLKDLDNYPLCVTVAITENSSATKQVTGYLLDSPTEIKGLSYAEYLKSIYCSAHNCKSLKFIDYQSGVCPELSGKF